MKIKNPRKTSRRAVDNVASSIKALGLTHPIVVDTTSVVIAGYARLLAARKLGLKSVPRLRAARPRHEYPKEGKQQ
jgi:ParB-like chromosome segregation protein Spo0J